MARASLSLAQILDKLESFYGRREPTWPTNPYEFLVWWQCGYPASDKSCAKGWEQLINMVGIAPEALLRARPQMLASALKAGGMVPEIRAERLKEIARRVQDDLSGDLRAALSGPLPRARKILKGFPGIADPGADRILLFGHIAPVAAVPSNCPHVLARIVSGKESENYTADYRDAQMQISQSVTASFEARSRAYLLVKQHGQEICKRTNPKCEKCVVNTSCTYFTNSRSGTAP